MYNFNILFQSLIRNIESVLKSIFSNTTKPKYKFYLDMVFGIMKSTSLVLNDIAFSLNETIALKKTNNRLYQNLMNEIPLNIIHNHIQKSLSYMDNNHYLFLVDDSDIIKPYGKKFEKLGVVRDGSSLKNTYEKGYMVTSIVGVSKTYKHPIPLVTKVHSSLEKGYKSTNVVTHEVIFKVIIHLKDYQGTFVFDRGFDNQVLMNFLIKNKQFFIIRMSNDRVIYLKNRKSKILKEALRRKGKIVIPVRYKGKKTNIKASHIRGKINKVSGSVNIIFSYLDGNAEPLVLITNKSINSKEDVIRIVLNYVSRWKIEELFRFEKVIFKLEDFRVKSLVSINNLMFILSVVILTLTHLIENQNRGMLYTKLISISKKIKDEVYIKYYQLMSGVKLIFTSNKKGVKNYKDIDRWETLDHNLFNSLELSGKKRVRKKQIIT